MIGATALRDEPLRVKHGHSGGREDNRKTRTEGAEQNQTEPCTAERNSGEQKDQRGRARHKSAACAQRDQAANADIAFRHMRVRMPVVRVGKRAVVMMMFVIVMMMLWCVQGIVDRRMLVRMLVFV